MKKIKYLIFLTCFISTSLFAREINLTCDDDNIFEGPMNIVINGAKAQVEGNFSGPGDAIFSVNYKNLTIEDLITNSDGSNIDTIKINSSKLFQLRLKSNPQGELNGLVQMISSDEDHMGYQGRISCSIK
jgi:hypothetical protein